MEKEEQEINPDNWVKDYGDYLFRYAYSRLNNRASAEDVVQEAFLGAFKNLDRFDRKADIKYWLLGILKHKVVDYIRKASRETQIEDPEALDMLNSFSFKWVGVPSDKPDPWRINPRKVFEQKEFWGVYEGCVSKVKGLPGRAYVLREMENLSTEEVCDVLNIDANYLWVLIHRARTQLKGCLEENWINRTKGTA